MPRQARPRQIRTTPMPASHHMRMMSGSRSPWAAQMTREGQSAASQPAHWPRRSPNISAANW